MKAYGADVLNEAPCCDDPNCDHLMLALRVACHPDQTIVLYDKQLHAAIVACNYCERTVIALAIADRTREIAVDSNGAPVQTNRPAHRHRSKR